MWSKHELFLAKNEPHPSPGNLLFYLTEYGKIGTGHTALGVGSFTEQVDDVLVPLKSSNWTYKDFNDQTGIVLQPTK